MKKKDLDLLLKYIGNIILNKPLPNYNTTDDSKEMLYLQEALTYLSDCLSESNIFLRSICEGKLNISPPGRHNFLAGNLKELHSILKHLTWQANQIANGDYNQRVSFLGEFSESFNTMIIQLEEREKKLKQQTQVITQSMELLTSIMEAENNCIIVTDSQDNKVLYKNKVASENYNFYVSSAVEERIIEHTKLVKDTGAMYQMIYSSSIGHSYFEVKSFPIQWSEHRAVAHYILNVTDRENEKQILSKLAFKDSLTDVYNRRFFHHKIKKYLEEKKEFTIVSVDINDLKKVNDIYGHLQGDHYIKIVVETLKDNIRENDYLCRIGGDEFILILHNYSELSAHKKLEKIFYDIEQSSQKYSMSISYGITHIDVNSLLTHEEIIKDSDEKMYLFKKEYKKSRKDNTYD